MSGDRSNESMRWVTLQRRGIDRVLAALSARVQQGRPGSLRDGFEAAVCEAFGFRRARLLEGPTGSSSRGLVRDGCGCEVAVPGGYARLRCELPTGQAVDDGQLRQVESLAALAAVVLAWDRWRPEAPRGRTAAGGAPELVGSSRAIRRVRERIDQVAQTPFPVLIQGETGVGKEVVARLLHDNSLRARGPFVAVNCAAIVDSLLEAELFGIEEGAATGVRSRRGKFELADGGTILLDEIGDLAPLAQAKLLRVLQDFRVDRVGSQRPVVVDVRVIAATNRDLSSLVAAGRFRADLFYRLNGVEIDIAPLRARLEDLDELVDYFLRRHADLGRYSVSPEARAALHDYDWPGNVRELERVIQRAMTLATAGVIRLEHLPPVISRRFDEIYGTAITDGTSLREFTTRYVRLVARQCGDNRRQACRVLGISYHTLRAYLEGRHLVRHRVQAVPTTGDLDRAGTDAGGGS